MLVGYFFPLLHMYIILQKIKLLKVILPNLFHFMEGQNYKLKSILLRDSSTRTGTADIYLGYTTDSINGYIDDFRIYQNNLPIEYIQNNIIGKITMSYLKNLGTSDE